MGGFLASGTALAIGWALLFRLAARYETECPLPKGSYPYERLTTGQEGARA